MSSPSLNCGRCGGLLEELRGICPHCGALLVRLRCGRCGFRGGVEDFPEGQCPRCLAKLGRLRWSVALALALLGLILFLTLAFLF